MCEGHAPVGLARRGRPPRLTERPASLAARGTRARCPRVPGVGALLRFLGDRARSAAKRLERVVGHLAGPDHLPERVEHVVGEPAPGARNLGEEDGAALREKLADGGGEGAVDGRRRAREEGLTLGQVERHPSVAAAEGFDARPHDLAGSAERIQVPGAIALDAGRQDLALEGRRDEGAALELRDDREQRVPPAPLAWNAVPLGEEPGERGRLHGLHRPPDPRQGLAAYRVEDLAIAQLEPRACREECPLEQTMLTNEGPRFRLERTRVDPQPRRDVGEHEGAVRPRVAREQVAQGGAGRG